MQAMGLRMGFVLLIIPVVPLFLKVVVLLARKGFMVRIASRTPVSMARLLEALMAMDSVCLDHVKQDGGVATVISNFLANMD